MTKVFLFALAFMSTSYVFSQETDDDWQIGGGENGATYFSDDQSGKNISKGNKGLGLFNGGYYESPIEISLGYVSKDWATKAGEGTHHENFFGERGKRLHGFGIGVIYQPCFDFGLGLRTGLHMELYMSSSDYVKQHNFDSFTELSFYTPAHVAYRFPLSRYSSLSLYGGLGFNIAASGKYIDKGKVWDSFLGEWVSDDYTESQRYGGEWPRRFNISGEFGVGLNINNIKLSVTYSKGLTNHHLYQGLNSHQNKLNITIGYVFTDNN